MTVINQVTPVTIPQLPASTGLTGNELFPVSQGGEAVKVAISALPQGISLGVLTYGGSGTAFPNGRTLSAGSGINLTDGGPGGSLTVSASSVAGTVTSVSVTTANGISGTVATPSTTPAITLTLGAITPTSVNSVVLSGSSVPTLAVTGTSTISGNNTGDQTSVTGNAGTATKWQTARNLGGNSVDGSANVAFSNKFIVQGTADSGLSGPQFLGALATGIVKNTTTTGVLSIAAAGTDYQEPITLTTTGSSGAATLIANTLNIPQYSGGSGPTLQTNGTPNGSQSLLNLVAGTNITLADNGTGSVTITSSATAATAFSALTGSTNTTAAMVVGSGASLAVSGTGTIAATTTNALKSASTTVDVSAATAPTSGQVLTATSGTAATWQTSSATQNPKTLACSNTAVSHTGDTAETTLVDYTLPANTLPANGTLRITMLWSRNSGGTSTVQPRVRFSTISGTRFETFSAQSTTNLTFQTVMYIYANNATNAQKAWGGNTNLPYQVSTSGLIIGAVDTTSATHLVFTGQCVNSGDTISLESYTIELLQP